MTDVAESAKRGLQGKIGPVPVWLIAGGLGIATVGGYYVYSKRSTGEPVATNATLVGSTDGTIDKTYSTAGYDTSGDVSSDSDSTFSKIVDQLQSVNDAQNDANAQALAQAQSQAQAALDAQQAQAEQQRAAQDAAYQQQLAAQQAATERAQAAADAAREAAERAAAAPAVQVVNSPAPAAAPAKAVTYSITTIPIGQTYTLQEPHKGYGSASDANSRKNAKTTVNPGSYKVNGREKLSDGYAVKLGSYWINV